MCLNLKNLIIQVKLKDSDFLKATVAINFGDFTIKGFRINKSNFVNSRNQNLWLQPPSYKLGGKYIPVFYVEDVDDWRELEEKVWDEYQKALNKSEKEKKEEQWI